MGYAKQMFIDATEQHGEDWLNHQDDELYYARMRDLGWDKDEADNFLDAVKEDAGL